MGSPNHGVPGDTKVFQPNYTFLYKLNDGDETPGGILNDPIGSRVDVIGGAIYNGTHTIGNINYTSIYSNGDNICSPYTTSRLDGANNIEVDGIEHIAMLYDESLYTIIKHAVYDDLSNGNTNDSSIPGYNLLILLGLVSLFTILIIKSQKIKI